MSTLTVSGDNWKYLKKIENQPIYVIYDSVFCFNLTKDSEAYLETYLKENKFNNVTIWQLEYREDPLKPDGFKDSLTKLIRYAIFKNQNLCDKLFVQATSQEYKDAADSVWPQLTTPITKLNDRDWPVEGFVCLFSPVEGAGSISPEYNDPINKVEMVSWFFEIENGTTTVVEEEILDKTNLTPWMTNGKFDINKITKARAEYKTTVSVTDNNQYLPDVEGIGSSDDSGSGGITYIYSLIYHYNVETTKLPISEGRVKVMNGLTSARNNHVANVVIVNKWLKNLELKRTTMSTDSDN